MILRNDDLDSTRYKMQFVEAMIKDLRWFGFQWQEGPDCGGPLGPYNQSERLALYRLALEKLRAGGYVYPCTCSRKDILNAARAPHAEDDSEPIYPGTCRRHSESRMTLGKLNSEFEVQNLKYSWRFRVPDGETIGFVDGWFGRQQFISGKDFGDFVVWRQDGVPAYQLACAVDDAAMGITEVVRGADLLTSTARQLLLFRALGVRPPNFFHCELMTDEKGVRLAKRHDTLSLRTLRELGETPEKLRSTFSAKRSIRHP